MSSSSPRPCRVASALRLTSLLALALFASACVRFGYGRVERFDPPDEERLQALAIGTPLEACLEQLGAPWQVLEQESERGLILIWAWERSSGWSFHVSGGDRNVTGSLEVDSSDGSWRSVVLWFDGDDRLERWHQGFLPAELASVLSRVTGRSS